MSEQRFRELLKIWGVPAFLISPDIAEFALSLVADEMDGKDGWGDCRIPADAIRHAQATVIAIEHENGEGVEVYAIDERQDRAVGDAESIVCEWRDNKMAILGNFIAGGHSFISDKLIGKQSPEQAHETAFIIAAVAFILSLINQPRLVRKSPMLSRQQRRAHHRGGFKAVDAWHRVTWDLSKETAAKVARDPTYHKVPLHWRRGHFRRAEAHYKGAIQRPDALREEERSMWWQWIEGQWVGHPAFGIKRSIHAPKLSTGDLARRKPA
ncbi:hypothetical protein Shpa_56 [Paracoccus phage Shpa]|uniref:Uncharacterized protein n=1 Tax=Paracoccus phage Shpa TaxID=1647282 RepID=A0A0U2BXG8_9CAUD|nr:hypothetical protein FDG85_gp55 [Paracoccus phage Shpa]AKG94566.1 hypothetical protein Shpa_56 [Paracoccus phage Shpa]